MRKMFAITAVVAMAVSAPAFTTSQTPMCATHDTAAAAGLAHFVEKGQLAVLPCSSLLSTARAGASTNSLGPLEGLWVPRRTPFTTDTAEADKLWMVRNPPCFAPVGRLAFALRRLPCSVVHCHPPPPSPHPALQRD